MFFSLLSRARASARHGRQGLPAGVRPYLAAEKRAPKREWTPGHRGHRAQGNEAAIARLEVALKRSERSRDDVQDSLEARERAVMGEDESRMILDATVAQGRGALLQIAEGLAPEVSLPVEAAVDAIEVATAAVQKELHIP